MIHLAIVSDIRIYREGISVILEQESFIKVVAVTDQFDDLIDVNIVNEIDLILFDMRIPNSHQVLSMIRSSCPTIKIIVIAVPEDNGEYIFCAQSGISGYLDKESTVAELKGALLTVSNGSSYCPKAITQHILDGLKGCNKKLMSSDNHVSEIKQTYTKLLDILTRRETQVVGLIAKGLSNKQIANKLAIELSTVKNHVHNILVKMGVESRTKAVFMLQESNSLHLETSTLDLDL